MKKSEMLYRAIGGISEDKIEDAKSHCAARERREVHGAVQAVGITLLICCFIAASAVLASISQRSLNNAVSDEATVETDTDGSTAMDNGTEEITKPDADGVTTGYTGEITTNESCPDTKFTKMPIEKTFSLDEVYELENIKDFLPQITLNNLKYDSSVLYGPGSFECEDGVYREFNEHMFVHFQNKQAEPGASAYREEYGDDYAELNILLINCNRGVPTEKISVDDTVQVEDLYGNPGISYELEWYTTDGWLVNYRYYVYPGNENDPTVEQELFELAASSHYFKDHFLK